MTTRAAAAAAVGVWRMSPTRSRRIAMIRIGWLMLIAGWLVVNSGGEQTSRTPCSGVRVIV